MLNRINNIYGFTKLYLSNLFSLNILGMENIYNFLQISNTIATSGQPTPEQFQAIKEAGYQVIINLALPESLNALKDEKQIVESEDLQYVHIPVVWENPTMENINDFFRVMEANNDKQVFVHCAANMRVSAFIYLYRCLHQGISDEDAKKDLQKIWIPNEIWQRFIEQVISIKK